MLFEPLRLAIYLVPHRMRIEPARASVCDEVLRMRRNKAIEIWLKCKSIESLLESLEHLLTHGYIASIAGLDGKIYDGIPNSIHELISIAMNIPQIKPETTVEAEILSQLDLKAIIDFTERIEIYNKKKLLKARISKPITIDIFFDRKLRLLKPWRAPP